MKIDIIRNRIKDHKILEVILKMFEYFCYINKSKEEEFSNQKNKEAIEKLLFELIKYVESGLKNKFSENFNVLITNNADFAIKFDPKYFLGLKYNHYDIIVFKIPYICIPTSFSKIDSSNGDNKDKFELTKKEFIENGFRKCFKMINFNSKTDSTNEDYIFNNLMNSIASFSNDYSNKDMRVLIQIIQYDLSKANDCYNWQGVISKKVLASQSFIDSCEVIYQAKFTDPDKKFIISNKLEGNEILIFKKKAVFESVLKNILSGKLYEVELKHIVILVSLVVFFFIITACKKDLTGISEEEMTFFRKECM